MALAFKLCRMESLLEFKGPYDFYGGRMASTSFLLFLLRIIHVYVYAINQLCVRTHLPLAFFSFVKTGFNSFAIGYHFYSHISWS